MGIQNQEAQHCLGAYLRKYHSACWSLCQKQWEDIKAFFIRKYKLCVSSISLLLPSRRWTIEEQISCSVIREAVANIWIGVVSLLAGVVKVRKELVRAWELPGGQVGRT